MITAENIIAVLLADGWHYVASKSFIVTDDYPGDFTDGPAPEKQAGFAFTESDGQRDEDWDIYGPLSSILAVKVAYE